MAKLRHYLFIALILVSYSSNGQSIHKWKNFSMTVPKGWEVTIMKEDEGMYNFLCCRKDGPCLFLNQADGERELKGIFGGEKVDIYNAKVGQFDAIAHNSKENGNDAPTQIQYFFNACGTVISLTIHVSDKDEEKDKTAIALMMNSLKCSKKP